MKSKPNIRTGLEDAIFKFHYQIKSTFSKYKQSVNLLAQRDTLIVTFRKEYGQLCEMTVNVPILPKSYLITINDTK